MSTNADSIIQQWRSALNTIVSYYDESKARTRRFHLKLFGVLVGINVVCYWFAMSTAFPEFTFGERWLHYFKMQLPIGLLAAAFEMLSVYITIFLMRHALATTSTRKYLGHLCFDVGVDLVIGFVAALWVIFSFTFSSWLVSYTTKLLTPPPKQTVHVQPQRPHPPQAKQVRQPRKKWSEMTKAERRRWLKRMERRKERRMARLRGTARDLAGKRDFAIYVFVDSLQHPFRNWRNFYFGTILGSTELLPSLLHFFFALRALLRIFTFRVLRPLLPSRA